MSRRELQSAVVSAAVDWWEGLRPLNWSVEQHLTFPIVNAASTAEYILALAVADYVESVESK